MEETKVRNLCNKQLRDAGVLEPNGEDGEINN